MRMRILPTGQALLLALVLLLGLAPAEARAKTSAPLLFADLRTATRLVADIQSGLHAVVEAEKNAILADTPDETQPFVRAAVEAAARVDQARTRLAAVLERIGRDQDKALFSDFTSAWSDFESLGREIRGLAEENTNRLAMDLSRGSATQAATRLEAALTAIMDLSAESPQALALTRRASELTAACLRILSLQWPHIVEPDDGRMDVMEAEMRARAAKGDHALEFLARNVPSTAQASLGLAAAAWKDFQRVNTEILALSRRNSDPRSLALALGRQRTLAAQCSDSLKALAERLLERNSKATR